MRLARERSRFGDMSFLRRASLWVGFLNGNQRDRPSFFLGGPPFDLVFMMPTKGKNPPILWSPDFLETSDES